MLAIGCGSKSRRYTSIDALCAADKKAGQDPPDNFGELEPPVGNKLAVHFLNVGHGNCILVECPGPTSKNSVLIDCGSGPARSLARDRAPQLRQKDTVAYIQRILTERAGETSVILTHPHMDHVSRVREVLKPDQKLGKVFLGGKRGSYSSVLAPSVAKWLSNVAADKIQDATNRTDTRQLDIACGGAKFYRLTADARGMKRTLFNRFVSYPNATSFVTLLRYGKFTAVFPGDATGSGKLPTTAKALQGLSQISPPVGGVSLMASAHHGSATHGSNNTEWTNGTRPQITVFSSSTSMGHPNCAAVKRYHKYAATRKTKGHDLTCTKGGKSWSRNYRVGMAKALYTTQDHGTIRVVTDGTTVRVGCDRHSNGTARFCGVDIPAGR